MNTDELRKELEVTDTSELRIVAGRMYGLDGPDTRTWTHDELVEWHFAIRALDD